jgi:hypothetical protein
MLPDNRGAIWPGQCSQHLVRIVSLGGLIRPSHTLAGYPEVGVVGAGDAACHRPRPSGPGEE